MLYPGGHVDARSYAPLARVIAQRGYLVVVPRVPLSLAFFDVNAADAALAEFPTIKTWAVAGHSLGGVAAALYAQSNPTDVGGLVLYASYPSEGVDFSESDLEVASTTGTLDGVVNRESLVASYPRLPQRFGHHADHRRQPRAVRSVRTPAGRQPGDHLGRAAVGTRG